MTTMTVTKAEKTGKIAKRIVRQSPAVELLERGIKHLHEKEYKPARTSFQAILDKHSDERDVCVRASSYLRACEIFLTPPSFVPETADDYYNLGILKHNNGAYDEAIEFISEAIKINPDGDHLYYAIAASSAFKNDLPSVLKNLERAIKLNPDNIAFAKNDPDFDSVHKEPGVAELLGLPPVT